MSQDKDHPELTVTSQTTPLICPACSATLNLIWPPDPPLLTRLQCPSCSWYTYLDTRDIDFDTNPPNRK